MLGVKDSGFIEIHRLYPADDFARQIEYDLLEEEVQACQEYLN